MATPEGQYIINGFKNLINQAVGIKSDLARIESKIPSEERIVSRIISAIKELLDAANKSLEHIITSAINSLKDLIIHTLDSLKEVLIQLIKSIFESGDSIDYNRIASIINDAIKSLKLNIDYDRINQIVSTAHNQTRTVILGAIAASQAALALAIAALIPAFRLAINALAAAIKSAITELGKIIAEAIIKVLRELLKNPSIDYDRISKIVNSAHQTTREIIVNQLYAKLEAGFFNLERLIKSLKLSVDYDRITQIVSTAHSQTRTVILGAIAASQAALALAIAALIPAFRLAINALAAAIKSAITELGKIIAEAIIKVLRELLKNPSIDYNRISKIVNSAHQTTREIIVNQLYAKLEAGFFNLERLIKSLKLSIDYNLISRIVNSAHQTTREIIVNQLYAKLEAGFFNLERLIKSLKLSIDYELISKIVDSAHKITQDIVIERLWYRINSTFYNLTELIKSLNLSVDYNRINQIINTTFNNAITFISEIKSTTIINAIEQSSLQLETTIKKILQSIQTIKNTQPKSVELSNISIPVFVKCTDDGAEYNQKTVSVPKGLEATELLRFQKIAEIESIKCKESVALVPEWWQVRLEGGTPQFIISFGEVNPSSGKCTHAKYAITIPHFKNIKPEFCPIPRYKKGNYELIAYFQDNSKLIINAFNEQECERVYNSILPWIEPEYLASIKYKVGKRVSYPFKEIWVCPKFGKYFSTGNRELNPDWTVYFE